MYMMSPGNIALIVFPLLLWLVGLVLGVCMIVWVFQIRKATRETTEETKKIAHTINDIYELLREHSETKD